MHPKLPAVCIVSLLLSASAQGQAGDRLQVDGTYEQFFVSGRFGGETRSRERFNRLMVDAEYGRWSLKASYWSYSFCNWYEVDESTLSYSGDNWGLKVGRFIAPVGQSNWYDQWYGGFVFLPLTDFTTYGGRKLLMRTSVGAEAEVTLDRHAIKASALSSQPEVNQVLPSRLDRASVRWNWHNGGITTGLGAYFDSKTLGTDERLLTADVRWTLPSWQLKGMVLQYKNKVDHIEAFFIEASHRPKGWTDVTLVGRYEQTRSHGKSLAPLETWTVGSKVRLPFDVTGVVNYTGGPDMNNVFLGGNLSFAIYKVFRF